MQSAPHISPTTPTRPLRRLWFLARYADLDLLELFLAGLSILFAVLAFRTLLVEKLPPAATTYQQITYSPWFWGYSISAGLLKVATVVMDLRRLRLVAAVLLAMMWTTLAVAVALQSLATYGWALYGWITLIQVFLITRRALEYGTGGRA